jgi:aspartyl-tRNA(Asn)/glutamyl-tRNA(Gln) amidotransferase subunit A
MAATLQDLSSDLAAGRTTSAALAEACLAAAADPQGEGKRVFIELDRASVLKDAQLSDARRKQGGDIHPCSGLLISIKDLFDVKGQISKAGSITLNDRPAALSDAPAVARLRAAGFILTGRTNMSEFAFSGLGLNPHYGTPRNPWDRQTGRSPGGSTSGGAVSVTDGMAHVALGTDTGGSCRIPAAFVGLVGFKPTARRVPQEGMIPLSTSLDSVGVLGPSVACCAMVDAVLAGEPAPDFAGSPVAGKRLAVVKNYVLEDMDASIAAAFQRTLTALSKAGAIVTEIVLPDLETIPAMNSKGGFPAAEAFAWHRENLAGHAQEYDPRVLVRIRRGEQQSAADYIDLLAARQGMIASVARQVSGFDALLFPTVPIVAPKLTDLETDQAFTKINLLALRNSTVINLLDGCAISVPMHRPGEPPAGLTVAAMAGSDRSLFQCASAIERAMGVD